MRFSPLLFLCALLAGCAAVPETERPDPTPLPGSIGVVVRQDGEGVIVALVKSDGPAEAAGVQPGDLVVRYNGVPVTSTREFNRLVIDSRPGSTAELELRRQGEVQRLRVPVEQLDTAPRARGPAVLRPA